MKLMHDISPARRPTLGLLAGPDRPITLCLDPSQTFSAKNGKCNQRFGDQSLEEDFKIMKEAARDTQNRATRTTVYILMSFNVR